MLGGRFPSRAPGGPDLERYLFWRGQHLQSRDLEDSVAGEEERLFWHNRAVHDAYGVVVGLAVVPGSGVPPEAADVAVHVGLAYDAYGRELALLEPATVPPPRDVGDVGDQGDEDEVWVLLLRYREQAADPCRRVASEGCGCGGAGEPRSELVWRRARRAGIKDGVALARGRWISGTAGWLFLPEEGFHPLRARPFARPRLGHGETPPGGTAWRPWSQPIGPSAVLGNSLVVPASARGIEVTVDSSAAGFTRTPCYFAWLQGGPWQTPNRLALTVLLERITGAARDRFTYSLWDPGSSTSVPSVSTADGFDATQVTQGALLNLARQRLYVCWLGIEMDRTALAARPHEVEPR